MGTIRKGILGGFSGKVGTVIGANRRGTAYMRSLPIKMKDARTLPQLKQRSKFALTLRFLKPMTGLLRMSWKMYAHHRHSPFNAVMSYTITNAISGTYPNYTIDPSKVLISIGSLSPAFNPTATPASGGGAIYFDWDNNSGSSADNATDNALLAVFNLDKFQAVFDTNGAQRADASQSINVPSSWAGDTLHAYIGFISQDGNEVSNSIYLGAVAVT